jgi:site-specific DNA-methyltransferase (adenine-specific)
MAPYYADSLVTIYHGDCRDVLPRLDRLPAETVVIADPPYAETSLEWDVWPIGWVSCVGRAVPASVPLWCFGAMRSFLAWSPEFTGWRLAQDVVWEKHNGSGAAADRFRRVHEHVLQWYRGKWGAVYKSPVTTPDATKRTMRRQSKPPHWGEIGASTYARENGGPRLMRSVIYCRSEHKRARNETQKPLGIVRPLIEYSCPPGGLVLSPFSGAGTDLVAAKLSGRRAIGIELRESQCEVAAERCRAETLNLEASA